MPSLLSGRVGVAGTHVSVTTEMLEQLNLTESTLGENLLAKDIGDLLYGDTFISLTVDGSAIEPDEAGQSSANGGVEDRRQQRSFSQTQA